VEIDCTQQTESTGWFCPSCGSRLPSRARKHWNPMASVKLENWVGERRYWKARLTEKLREGRDGERGGLGWLMAEEVRSVVNRWQYVDLEAYAVKAHTQGGCGCSGAGIGNQRGGGRGRGRGRGKGRMGQRGRGGHVLNPKPRSPWRPRADWSRDVEIAPSIPEIRLSKLPKKENVGAAKVIARTGFCVSVIFTQPRSVLIGSS